MPRHRPQIPYSHSEACICQHVWQGHQPIFVNGAPPASAHHKGGIERTTCGGYFYASFHTFIFPMQSTNNLCISPLLIGHHNLSAHVALSGQSMGLYGKSLSTLIFANNSETCLCLQIRSFGGTTGSAGCPAICRCCFVFVATVNCNIWTSTTS